MLGFTLVFLITNKSKRTSGVVDTIANMITGYTGRENGSIITPFITPNIAYKIDYAS
jgi:hypothetical protein